VVRAHGRCSDILFHATELSLEVLEQDVPAIGAFERNVGMEIESPTL